MSRKSLLVSDRPGTDLLVGREKMVSGVPRRITEVQQQHYQRELHSPEKIVKKTYKPIGKGNNSKGSNSNSHDKSNSKSKHSNSNSNSRDSGKSNNKGEQ